MLWCHINNAIVCELHMFFSINVIFVNSICYGSVLIILFPINSYATNKISKRQILINIISKKN